MKKVLRMIVLLAVFFGLGIYFIGQRLGSNISGGPDTAAEASSGLTEETPQRTSLSEKAQPADRISASASERKTEQLESNIKITDRFIDAAVIESRESVPDRNGHYERKRLVRADFKYPLVLLEESLQRDSQTGAEQILKQTAMVADHVMVKVPAGVSGDQLDQTVSAYGGHIRKKMYSPGLYLVEFQNVDLDSVSQAIQNFSKASGAIAYAEPDYIGSIDDTTPNDTNFSLLWGMHNTGQTIGGQTGIADADIDAPAAWDFSMGSTNIVVAVIDTGIDYSHPDLAGNMWHNPGEIPGNNLDDDGNGFIDDVYGWDFANDDNDPLDDHYHGTHCAGTIGGIGNNAAGVAGVNWMIRLMALKFLGSSGSGATSDAVDATHYATMMKVKLTSNSWGGGGYSRALFDVIEEAGRSNILFIAAAGNSGANTDTQPFYPSSYANENIISVAATDNRDQLAGFSNYGLLSVDVGAPGVSIYSCQPGGRYQYLSGTSMATPHVAGACALMWSVNLNATAAAIKQAILNGAEPIEALSGKCVTGGRLNIYSALREIEQNISITPATGFSSSGFSGGSFIPPAGTYTINNIGTNTFSWAVAKTADWLDLSLISGSLSPGQSNTVNVSINVATANTLAVGTYTDTLTFSNTVSTNEQTRTVSLTVRGEITFDSASYTVSEGGETALISVRRDGNTNRVVTVDFATSNGTATAGSDYTATNGTLVFAEGETVKNFTVPILDDSLPSEENESVILTLGNPTGGGTLGNPSTAVLTILDNDFDTHYVSLAGGNIAPYTNWTMAATSIQPAVDVAASGDVVRVAAETYVLSSRISIPAGITVQGAGAGATIVDGNNTVGCFLLAGNAGVAGMTIKRGYVVEGVNGTDGGGVTGGIVSNCTLSGNWASYGGGGVDHSTLYNCTLSSNSAGVAGGGAWLSTLYDCTLTGNSSVLGNGHGGGAYWSTLYNCTLSSNSAKIGGGMAGGALYNCLLTGNSGSVGGGGAGYATLYNCTLSGNTSPSGDGAQASVLYNSIVYPDSVASVTFYNGWTNDPNFVGSGNYSLRFDSPCIGAANPATATTNDILGFMRDQFPDIGAFEYVPQNGYYVLMVNNGTGGGYYTNGVQVEIAANAPAVGKVFGQWVGDTQIVASVTSSTTTVTMPAGNVALTATYKDVDPQMSITNLTVAQRPGTKLVDITYDMSSATTNPIWISLTVSNGVSAVTATNLTGAVNTNVSAGVGKSIVWNAGTDWNGSVASLTFSLQAGDYSAPSPSGMVLIPAGTNSGTDPDYGAYLLTNAESFYMDATEVTKAQWDTVRAWAVTNGYSFENVGSGSATNHPVQTVNWYDSTKWCNARSQKEGRTPCYTVSGSTYKTGQSIPTQNTSANGYRLPTSAEWKYAARGGLSGKRFPWGDTITHSNANYYSVSSLSYDISPTRGSHPVYAAYYTSPAGSFAPNGYGLYDMAGNVWEWCWDPLSTGRNIQGGSWNLNATVSRCGYATWFSPADENNSCGFRAVCSSVAGDTNGSVSSSKTVAIDTRDYVLTVASAYGTPVPMVGTNLYAWQTTISCSVDGAISGRTNSTCAGWQGTGAVPSLGDGNTTGEILLTNLNSSITWNWPVITVADLWVENVTATQRPGTKMVDISYDVFSTKTNAANVMLSVLNGTGSVNAPTVSGDVGPGIASGDGKTIAWAAGVDWNSNLDNLTFRILGQDAQGACITVPAGRVKIPAGQNAGTDPEAGAYSITMTNSLFMDVSEITKAQWDTVCGWALTNGYSFANPGSATASNYPVHTVSWYDAVKWCNARSQMEGFTLCYNTNDWSCDADANGYRLPTREEWQYAARGGLSGQRFPWGNTIAHSNDNYYSSASVVYDVSETRGFHPLYGAGTAPEGVGTANGYGLYAMAGNVMEWCQDASGTNRAVCGGSWNQYASEARCVYTVWGASVGANDTTGFRTVQRASSSSQAESPSAVSVDTRDYLLVVSSERGTPVPMVGTNLYAWRATVTGSVQSIVISIRTNWTSAGWSGSGSVPVSGVSTNTGSFVLTGLVSSITWNWNTNYLLGVYKTGGGNVSTSGGWVACGTNVQVTAVPDTYYHFTGWSGDLITNSAALTLVMNRPYKITGNFAPNITVNTETPEWWLAQYGLTNFAADVLVDPDFDGQQTWQEYIAGTNPTDSNSVLRVVCTVRPNGNRIISWLGAQGRAYTLQYADSLTNDWRSASFESPGAGVPVLIEDSLGTSNGFYRVKVRVSE